MGSKNVRRRALRHRTFELLEDRRVMSADPLGGPVGSVFEHDVDTPFELHSNVPMLASAHGLTGLTQVRNDYGFIGTGQTVAVIDSGIAYNHVALGGGVGPNFRVVGGWDFAENDNNFYDDGPAGSHGTFVTGVVGADRPGTADDGVAPGVDLVGLRVFDDNGAGNFDWIESALQWVHQNRNAFENPITAVNLSIGSDWNSTSVPAWSMLEDEFAQLKADGIFIAVSAGNAFPLHETTGLSYPAASPHVVPVMSVDDDGSLSFFSQRHTSAIAAPGRSIVSTIPDYAGNHNGVDDDYATFSGTDMASPYVAGASVLLREAMQFLGHTNITQVTIFNHLMATADSFFDAATNQTYKRLNLANAFNALMPADDFGSSVGTAHDLGTLSGTSQISGLIGKLSDSDYFRFTAAATGTVTFTASTTHGLNPVWSGSGTTSGTEGEVYTLQVVAGATYTIGLSTSGGIGFYDIAVNAGGTFSNHPPVLATIGNKTVAEGSLLTFTAVAGDPNAGQTLTYSLTGAPAGASIHATTGVFTWTPTEGQGPGTYSVTVRVTDNGSPALSDSETISITVSEANVAPVLAPIGNKTVTEGSLLTFTATSTDADLPANGRTFSLTGAPAGASIHATTGVFTWTPTTSQGPATYNVTVQVTDNGSPALSDSETISITVSEGNAAPVMATIGNKTVAEGSLLTFTAVAGDPNAGQTLTYSLTGAPAGASIHTTTGVFMWTPTESQGPGTYSVTVRVTDNGSPALSDSETISITVGEANVAPVLAAIGNKTVVEGSLLTFTATATDADLPANGRTFSLTGAPAGASIHATTGVFTWTPTEGQGPGTYSVTVRVTDNGSPALSDSETISITVSEANLAPVLAPIGNKTVTEGSLLTFTATATDADLPANGRTFSLTGAPAGASIHATTGVFTWTPTTSQGPGTYNVTVRVTDNGSPALSDSETISITVSEGNAAPVLATIGNKTVAEGSLLTFTAVAGDPNAGQTLTYSLTGAPAGASIHATTGVFTWTPTEGQGPGTYSVTVRVTDNGSPALSDSETISITVSEANLAPVLAAIGNKTVVEGSLLTFTATATDADLPANGRTFSLTGAPAGASIHATTGVFTWTPTEGQGPGTYSVTVRVTDNGSPALSDSETISITVSEANLAPVLAPIGNKTVTEGSLLTFTATATDADLPANGRTFSLTGAPAGASIHATTGVFTWTPTTSQGPGTYNVTVRVTDNGSPALSDSETISITVSEGNAAPVRASLVSGVLQVVGSEGDDVINFRQTGATIYINGVPGSFAAKKVKSIVVNLNGGNDTVSLDSFANGGSRALAESVTIRAGLGNELVRLANGQQVNFGGVGNTLFVSSAGAAWMNGAPLNFTSSIQTSWVSGVLTITGTNGSNTLNLLKAWNSYIAIQGVPGAWPSSGVSSIVINLQEGGDQVSLDSFANGGSFALGIPVTVNSGTGNKQVILPGGQPVNFAGYGHQLRVAADGSATYDGAPVPLVPNTIQTDWTNGVLTVTGTNNSDTINIFKAWNGYFDIQNIPGAWPSTGTNSIVIHIHGGNDFVSLNSLANGGSFPLNVPVTVHSGPGNNRVFLPSGNHVDFSGYGHVLQVAADGSATYDGFPLTFASPATNLPDTTSADDNGEVAGAGEVYAHHELIRHLNAKSIDEPVSPSKRKVELHPLPVGMRSPDDFIVYGQPLAPTILTDNLPAQLSPHVNIEAAEYSDANEGPFGTLAKSRKSGGAVSTDVVDSVFNNW